jgi:membrane protein
VTVFRHIADVLKATAVNWLHDYAQSMGAALAFYTMFSIAPLLLIVISIAGVVFGEEAARGEIYHQLDELLGANGASAVRGMLENTGARVDNVLTTVFGSVLLFIGATSVFAELQDALDRIWRAPFRVRSSGLWRVIRARLLSFGMILGIGFLLIVSLAFSAGLSALVHRGGPLSQGWLGVADASEIGLSIVLLTVVFAMIYKTMPRARVDWRDVWVGAAVTSMLFIAGKLVIGVYLGHSGISTAYGAAASLVIVLLWVYYSAQIFLFGAEFTWVYCHKFGSRRGQAMPVTRDLAVPPP